MATKPHTNLHQPHHPVEKSEPGIIQGLWNRVTGHTDSDTEIAPKADAPIADGASFSFTDIGTPTISISDYPKPEAGQDENNPAYQQTLAAIKNREAITTSLLKDSSSNSHYSDEQKHAISEVFNQLKIERPKTGVFSSVEEDEKAASDVAGRAAAKAYAQLATLTDKDGNRMFAPEKLEELTGMQHNNKDNSFSTVSHVQGQQKGLYKMAQNNAMHQLGHDVDHTKAYHRQEKSGLEGVVAKAGVYRDKAGHFISNSLYLTNDKGEFLRDEFGDKIFSKKAIAGVIGKQSFDEAMGGGKNPREMGATIEQSVHDQVLDKLRSASHKAGALNGLDEKTIATMANTAGTAAKEAYNKGMKSDEIAQYANEQMAGALAVSGKESMNLLVGVAGQRNSTDVNPNDTTYYGSAIDKAMGGNVVASAVRDATIDLNGTYKHMLTQAENLGIKEEGVEGLNARARHFEQAKEAVVGLNGQRFATDHSPVPTAQPVPGGKMPGAALSPVG